MTGRILDQVDTAMTVSVIIVSWNAKAYLLRCIQSILDQQLENTSLEIIVVDNASSDGSPEAVRETFPQVRLICSPDNAGFAKANNIGIRACSGDYVFLINSDVEVKPGCFSALMNYLDANPRIGILGPKIIGGNGLPQRSCMSYPSLWNSVTRALALDVMFPKSRLFSSFLMAAFDYDRTQSVDVINGCFWLVRKQALAQVGGLDEDFFIYGEDVDWCRRFNSSGWGVVFFPQAAAVHYGGASSSNAPVRFYLEMQKANYQYWLKHHSLLASNASLVISVVHHSIRLVGIFGRKLLTGFRVHPGVDKTARNVATLKWLIRMLTAPAARRALQSSSVAELH